MKRRQIRLPYKEAANIRGVETLLFLAQPDALPDGAFAYHIYIDNEKKMVQIYLPLETLSVFKTAVINTQADRH